MKREKVWLIKKKIFFFRGNKAKVPITLKWEGLKARTAALWWSVTTGSCGGPETPRRSTFPPQDPGFRS